MEVGDRVVYHSPEDGDVYGIIIDEDTDARWFKIRFSPPLYGCETHVLHGKHACLELVGRPCPMVEL